ncbi:MAG: ATP synthase F0 subunit B [bacterium]|nr:ATP synthase F0 subunit B [bacterium]
MADPSLQSEAISPTRAEPVVGGFVERFGLDPWLLLAQVVNFLVVLWVLRRFVFRPLLQMLSERQTRIRRGHEEAEQARVALTAAEQEAARRQADAAAAAARTVRAAEEEAHRLREHIVRAAEEEAAQIHDRAERELARVKQDALAAAAAEMGDLVVETAGAVLFNILTPVERARYREKALEQLKEYPGVPRRSAPRS